MPLKPINPDNPNWIPKPCLHREHNPPGHMVIREPMEHECPACGKITILRPLQIFP